MEMPKITRKERSASRKREETREKPKMRKKARYAANHTNTFLLASGLKANSVLFTFSEFKVAPECQPGWVRRKSSNGSSTTHALLYHHKGARWCQNLFQ